MEQFTEQQATHNQAVDWLNREVVVAACELVSGNSSVPFPEPKEDHIGVLGFDAESDRYFITDETNREIASLDRVYYVEDDKECPRGRRLILDGWSEGEEKRWYRWTVEL